MKVTMIGHSTVVLETERVRMITDPWFGPWGNPAYRRTHPPARKREALRDVDIVLISHTHFDHTDRRYLRSLSGDIPVVVPSRAALLARFKGARNVVKLANWESRDVGGVEITSVPASHIGPSCGYVIRCEGKQVYFAGDTFFRAFMGEVGRRFNLDLALLPVFTYRIPMTMSETSAVKAAEALKPKAIIPIHLALQPRLPLLRTRQSADGFRTRIEAEGLGTQVSILKEGESRDI